MTDTQSTPTATAAPAAGAILDAASAILARGARVTLFTIEPGGGDCANLSAAMVIHSRGARDVSLFVQLAGRSDAHPQDLALTVDVWSHDGNPAADAGAIEARIGASAPAIAARVLQALARIERGMAIG